MDKKRIYASLLAYTLLPTTALAFGNADAWKSGWGQGVSEFVIKGKGQSQLYLTCEDEGTRPATIIFTDVRGHQTSIDEGKTLQVQIDRNEAIDISDSDSRVGDGNLTLAWNAMRTGKQVTVSGDGVRSATFTLSGAGKVLPAFNTHGCVSKFAL
ncbi:hypothetical protein [Rahnella laticis]|uniref:hypothetical protein n=1 Tax=Rahnella laticis TaxID=2787622 RepID=UPI0018A2EEAE|nr:hypothetical protein [Rahnella laticis]MBF7994316.1 hypothetical protein [Rahnella laticis]